MALTPDEIDGLRELILAVYGPVTEELLRDLPLLLRGGAEPLQETGALRGFGKILYFTASPDPVWRSLTAGAEPVLLLCGVPEQPDVRCICYTKEDYAAALQQLEL